MMAALEEEDQVYPQPQVRVDLTAKEPTADFTSSVSRRIFGALSIIMDFLTKISLIGMTTPLISHHGKSRVELLLPTILLSVE